MSRVLEAPFERVPWQLGGHTLVSNPGHVQETSRTCCRTRQGFFANNQRLDIRIPPRGTIDV